MSHKRVCCVPKLGTLLTFKVPTKATMKKNTWIWKQASRKRERWFNCGFFNLDITLWGFIFYKSCCWWLLFSSSKSSNYFASFCLFFHFSALCQTVPSSPKDSNLLMIDAFSKEFGKWISIQFWCKSLSLWGFVTSWLIRILEIQPRGLCEVGGKKRQNNSAKMYLIFKAAIMFYT